MLRRFGTVEVLIRIMDCIGVTLGWRDDGLVRVMRESESTQVPRYFC